ncbi:MAG: hypothetical protein ACRD0Y_14215 [Terriglobales bacterium]
MPSSFAFTPTPTQRRLLDFVHEHTGRKTITAICTAAGVSRNTYYRWCKDPGFRTWFAAAWSARLVFQGMDLINIARYNSGNFRFWKALFDLTFDPKGLTLLAQWQQSLATLSNDAFDASGDDPNASSTGAGRAGAQDAPSPAERQADGVAQPPQAPYQAVVTPPPQSNQPLTPPKVTNHQKSAPPAYTPAPAAPAPTPAPPPRPVETARLINRLACTCSPFGRHMAHCPNALASNP